jgi:general secretion pathway protein B
MSFILDALKKSESDRQRQSGPALFEVRVAPPRTRLPLWAIAIALLLVLNLGVVLWMLVRHQSHAGASAASTSAAGAAGAALAPSATSAPAAAAAAAPAATAAPGAAAAPPSPAGAVAPAGASVPVLGVSAPASPAPAATPATPAPATAATGAETGNAEDYAPAAEPGAPAPGSHVRRATASGVPLYQDLAGTPGTQLPQLRLDLHVFAARAEDRFVMVNMHRLREGDTLPEGVHLDSITPEGAVMTYNGTKFLLPRD